MLKFDKVLHERVYFSSDEKILDFMSDDRIVAEKDIPGEGKLFIRATSNPELYHYGLIQTEDNYLHNAGYIWSSRIGVINKYFDTAYTEIHVGSAIYAMEVDTLKKYLPSDYEVVKNIRWEDEIYYEVKRKF